MKNVGATDWYIRWPFIFEGLIIGIIASVISLTVTYFLYNAFSNSLGTATDLLGVLTTEQAMPTISFAIVSLGVLLGCLGSALSIKKHLIV